MIGRVEEMVHNRILQTLTSTVMYHNVLSEHISFSSETFPKSSCGGGRGATVIRESVAPALLAIACSIALFLRGVGTWGRG